MRVRAARHRSSRLRAVLRGPIAALGWPLTLLLAVGAGVSSSWAQVPGDPVDAPSAAGELFLLRREGLAPPPPAPAARRRALREQAIEAPAEQPGVNTIVNNPANDTPESTTQSETSLAVRGNTICAGYNNSGAGGFSGLSRSANLGASWTDLGGIGQSGDPVLVVHNGTGTFYYAEIATIGGQPAIGVAASTNDCQSFGAPVNASPGASAIPTTTLNDKPWIAVDNTGGANDGNVYVCWTRFDSVANSELRFSRSVDGGATFTNEQILAPGGTSPFGCSVGVGPNGQVHVAWADRAGATANDIRFRSSTDGGINFSAAISISTGNRHPGIDTIVTCPTGANPGATRPTLNGNIRMLHQAWLAVDTTGGPFNGNIYVVWASDPPGTPDNSDVFFSRSTNGGGNWSAPVQIGGGGGATDQFEPFVAVGGFGTVSIAWYDRRNDAANDLLIDVFKTFSRDGGVTIDPIVRVTSVNFPVPPINPNFDPGVVNCYMGEYIAVTADRNNFYYLWGDNRNTLVTPNFPGGRPDPDVFFDAEAVPPISVQVPPIADAGPDQTVSAGPACTAAVVLNGTGSVDPNGDVLTFTWTGPFGTANGPTPTVTLPLGVSTITLTVDDGHGGTSSDTVVVTVVDTTPPTITPVPVVAEQTSLAGTPVVVPPPTVVDNCPGPITLTSDAPAVFPLGATTVTFKATDAAGNTGTASTTVTVVDTTPPTIASVTPNPNSLWPPNHRMVPISVAVSVSDICDVAPACHIASVSSNEPANGLGDGDTAPDIQVTGALTVNLRAERSGTGKGRVYTIAVTCTDASGNSATKTAIVSVPHSQAK